MADAAGSNDLVKITNFLLDNVLGLDGSSAIAGVSASRGAGNAVTIDIKVSSNGTAAALADLLHIKLTPEQQAALRSGGMTLGTLNLEADIKAKIDAVSQSFVDRAISGITGVERGVAVAATEALRQLVSWNITTVVSHQLGLALVDLGLPSTDPIAKAFDTTLHHLGASYFNLFVPDLVKTFGKMGLTELLTAVGGKADTTWIKAVHDLQGGILDPILDNIVNNYFVYGPPGPVLNGVNFSKALGKATADLLINFDKLDKKIVDDILGIDGTGSIDNHLAALLDKGIPNLVGSGFGKTLDFLAGHLSPDTLKELGAQFNGAVDLTHLVGDLFTTYAGNELAQLFVKIDSLPEALASQLGSLIGRSALGDSIGSILGGLGTKVGGSALTDLFGSFAADAIGSSVFEGLGAILGAGIGGAAGAIVFKFADRLFGGAISGLINHLVEAIENKSPQAFNGIDFDPIHNVFVINPSYEHSKDSTADLRKAVKMLADGVRTTINEVYALVGQQATVDGNYADIIFAWGKKHFNKSFASYIVHDEGHKISYHRDGEQVLRETVGAILHHTNFHAGNGLIAAAFDIWKAGIAATGGGEGAYATVDALTHLQDLIGLARFAIAYRQDPTVYDALMASDAPIGVTILQQFMQAEAQGFNAPNTVHGSSDLTRTEIGSAAAGDLLYLDGNATRAIARGGDDTIVTGTAARQYVDGGSGIDTLVIAGSRAAYTVVNLGNGSFALAGGGITVTTTGVERVEFAGRTVAADTLLGGVTVFDPLRYLASNPDLARTYGASAAQATEHYLAHGLAEHRALTTFDPWRYLASNPDLARSYGADVVAAETHYILHGIAEGRSIASFDALRYIASNADLARGYGTDTVAATHHYVEYGLAEGRSATAFDPLRYLASNPDLARGFGTDAAAAERHYIQYGLAERRSATAFDPVAYLAANADLARGYRYDLAAAETHYIQAGLREGRATGGFDAVAYLLSNRDLATGGLTVQQALTHWITNGAAEGRSGDAAYGREQTSHAVAVGGVVADALQGAGDRDWFGVALAAGQHVAIRAHGTGFSPTLAVADEHGVQRAFATGAGGDATIDFTADHAATYYLTAASAGGAAGNYLVDVHAV